MCNQRRGSILGSLVLSVITIVLFTGISLALVMTVYSRTYAQTVGPYDVIVYEHADFIGASRSWRLEPYMRQKLVPYVGDEINDRISSIHVGSKVGVAVFVDADFGGTFYYFQSSQQGLNLTFNDSISSLIIYPKEMLQPLGVWLMGQEQEGFYGYIFKRFFPPPELKTQGSAKYPWIGAQMNDRAESADLYPRDPNSPAYGKIQVRLCESANFAGRCITIPGPGSQKTVFNLGNYQFYRITSSVEVTHKP